MSAKTITATDEDNLHAAAAPLVRQYTLLADSYRAAIKAYPMLHSTDPDKAMIRSLQDDAVRTALKASEVAFELLAESIYGGAWRDSMTGRYYLNARESANRAYCGYYRVAEKLNRGFNATAYMGFA